MKKDHVWSYDMVMDRTSDGRLLRTMVIIDDYTRECLSMYMARSIKSHEVLDKLYELFLIRGTPEYLRSDNGSEFTANVIRSWLRGLGVTALYIEPGSPWENGYVESFIGKLRDELLNGEILDTLMEAKVLVEARRMEYNRFRPHSFLGYMPPAPEAFMLTPVVVTDGGRSGNSHQIRKYLRIAEIPVFARSIHENFLLF